MAVQTKVDINRASREELMEIEGIGESMADAIIRYRVQKGPFKSLEDIDKVPGIGESRLEHIKQLISVSGESSQSRRESEGRSSQSQRESSSKASHQQGSAQQHGSSKSQSEQGKTGSRGGSHR